MKIYQWEINGILKPQEKLEIMKQTLATRSKEQLGLQRGSAYEWEISFFSSYDSWNCWQCSSASGNHKWPRDTFFRPHIYNQLYPNVNLISCSAYTCASLAGLFLVAIYVIICLFGVADLQRERERKRRWFNLLVYSSNGYNG